MLLAGSLAAAVFYTQADDWEPLSLFVALLALALVGQFLSVRTGAVQIGPAFVATALAMALLGPAPAAVIAVAAVLGVVDQGAHPGSARLQQHRRAHDLSRGRRAAVQGARGSRGGGRPPSSRPRRSSSASTSFTNFLNFLLIVGYLCLRDGTSLLLAVRRLYLPVVPWEVATGTLTAGTVLAYQEVGLLAVAMLAVILMAYRYLLGSVVDAQRQRDELRAQVHELEALHHGVIRVMVETLGMRDRMTARHSAAVARFAKATAAAAGLSGRDQELVHTAGLLHDIGKFTFPDHTLTGVRLTEEDWELIRSHPQRGADIVGRVHGYADVAEIVLCHHERIDGRGYPRNLAGEDIPVLARILAVADCFDVMTARDSYRTPMGVRGRDRRAPPGGRDPARRALRGDLRRCRDGVRRGLPSRGRRGPRGRAAAPGAAPHGRLAPRAGSAQAASHQRELVVPAHFPCSFRGSGALSAPSCCVFSDGADPP